MTTVKGLLYRLGKSALKGSAQQEEPQPESQLVWGRERSRRPRAANPGVVAEETCVRNSKMAGAGVRRLSHAERTETQNPTLLDTGVRLMPKGSLAL